MRHRLGLRDPHHGMDSLVLMMARRPSMPPYRSGYPQIRPVGLVMSRPYPARMRGMVVVVGRRGFLDHFGGMSM